MSTQPTRPCPRCKRAVPSNATRCPHCNADLSIITMPVEPVPSDVGAPDDDAEATAIEPATAEILPPIAEPSDRRRSWTGSYSMSTTFSTVTSAGRGSAGHTHAEVKIDLPQDLIDPDRRLSPAAYWRLRVDWSKAIEREIEAVLVAGGQLSLADAVQRVPLPFGPNSGGELPVAIKDQLTQRARQQAAQLLSAPTPESIFGPHAGPGSRLPMPSLPDIARSAGRPQRRGLTITCGSALGLLLGGVVAAVVGWWVVAAA